MDGRYWALLGTLVWALVLGIPYSVLKDTASYWANFLFWTILTLSVLVVGILKVRQWGE